MGYFGVALSPPPRTNVLVDGVVGPLVAPVIEMRNVVPSLRLARPEPLPETAVRIGGSASLPSRPLVLMLRVLGALRTVPSISSGFVEGRWRPSEGATLLVQPTRRTRTKVGTRGRMAVVAAGMGARRWRTNVHIVLRALLWDGEDVVGLADGDEARGRGRVGRVVVRVVLLGQGIELAFYISGAGRGRELQDIIVSAGAGWTARRDVERDPLR